MMTGMTPEEATDFDEQDEDPREVFAWFDDGPHGVTAQAPGVQQPAQAHDVSRVLSSGLYGHLRHDLLPEVSATGSNTRYAQQA
jgi:hypothetical protein